MEDLNPSSPNEGDHTMPLSYKAHDFKLEFFTFHINPTYLWMYTIQL